MEGREWCGRAWGACLPWLATLGSPTLFVGANMTTKNVGPAHLMSPFQRPRRRVLYTVTSQACFEWVGGYDGDGWTTCPLPPPSASGGVSPH
ncbi:uncharacterized protein LY79DRAFT_558048 [Colletotrichum navitas]|uniref:Uncharacterized protein n=1 Tax=Colletotrichum navitas TaxID=681940 RepID=A0AAD8V4A0_9PEZI|nr:uncharacterized protein LY79DRAFT_558048 [Colletotrichum navitas]KAK1585670.1 hypothetical protein LY79DRAFT_558048 [Colletotrichum navitas]